MGSTDRRVANRLVYNYFRIGRALPNLPEDERLMVAERLSELRSRMPEGGTPVRGPITNALGEV